MTFRQIRSLGVRKARSDQQNLVSLRRLTSGDVDEGELELRAELGQVSRNVHVELR